MNEWQHALTLQYGSPRHIRLPNMHSLIFCMQASELPNPSAGVDVVNLADGRFLLIYNPTTQGRHQLALAVSEDGERWEQVTLLEDSEGEYSYPAMIQAEDGGIHITYTWRREKVKYVVVDLNAV